MRVLAITLQEGFECGGLRARIAGDGENEVWLKNRVATGLSSELDTE
jgi:hypothetical protein